MAKTRTIGKFSKASNPPAAADRFTVENDGYRDRLGIIPNKVTPLDVKTWKQQAERGELHNLQELYTKMETTDPRYGGLVASLKSAVSGMPLKVNKADGTTPGENEIAEDYAKVMEETITHLDQHKLIKQFADAYVRGVRVFEIKYALKQYPYNRELWGIDEIRPISPSALKMDMVETSDRYGELMIVTRDYPEGRYVSDFPEGKLIVVEDGEGNARYDTMGVARQCIGWWLVKVYTQVYWSQYTETYGQPLRIGRYAEGSSNETKSTIKRFLRSLGRNGYGMFPQGVDVQLIESNQQGSVQTYQDVLKWASDEMAMAILGQVETMGGRRQGSYAKAKVLDGVRYDILKDVSQIVSKGFKQLTHAIILANYGTDAVRRLYPSVEPLLVNPQDVESKAKAFKTMSDAGLAISTTHMYEELGMPRPAEGEEVLHRGSTVNMGEDGKPEVDETMQQQQNPQNTTEESGESDEESQESGSEQT